MDYHKPSHEIPYEIIHKILTQKMSFYSLNNSQLKLIIKVKPNAKNTGIMEITDGEIIINVREYKY